MRNAITVNFFQNTSFSETSQKQVLQVLTSEGITLTGILLRSQKATKAAASIVQPSVQSVQDFTQNEVFLCAEESHFYSHCLERLVFPDCTESDFVVEFGCGDGSPVINALTRSTFRSVIYGYELNPSAYDVACSRAEQRGLSGKYVIQNQSFFDSQRPKAQYLIANPPYLPAIDNQIRMPLLHGGTDGATLTNRLLTLDYPSVMTLISSYSNPVGTITHALEQGYRVADFMVTPLPFGYYSSEPKVKHQIEALHRDRKAFYSNNIYFLAGVLFQKDENRSDLSTELIQVMTAL